MTNRLPSELLCLEESEIFRFEVDYQLIMKTLEGKSETTEEKAQKIKEWWKCRPKS